MFLKPAECFFSNTCRYYKAFLFAKQIPWSLYHWRFSRYSVMSNWLISPKILLSSIRAKLQICRWKVRGKVWFLHERCCSFRVLFGADVLFSLDLPVFHQCSLRRSHVSQVVETLRNPKDTEVLLAIVSPSSWILQPEIFDQMDWIEARDVKLAEDMGRSHAREMTLERRRTVRSEEEENLQEKWTVVIRCLWVRYIIKGLWLSRGDFADVEWFLLNAPSNCVSTYQKRPGQFADIFSEIDPHHIPSKRVANNRYNIFKLILAPLCSVWVG